VRDGGERGGALSCGLGRRDGDDTSEGARHMGYEQILYEVLHRAFGVAPMGPRSHAVLEKGYGQ
jgi:hypothetical protein